MTESLPSASVTPGELRRQIQVVAEGALTRLTPEARRIFDRVLTRLDQTLQEALQGTSEVRLPWAAPRAVLEALQEQVAQDPEERQAAPRRLWQVLRMAKLVTGRFGMVEARRRPTVANLAGPAWSFVQEVLAIRAFLQSDAAIPGEGLPLVEQEAHLIRHAILAMATAGLAFPSLTRIIATLTRSAITWKSGVIALPASTKVRSQGAPQRYYLPPWAMLHLIALERFYQTRGRSLRPESATLLPAGWQRSGRVAKLLREYPHRSDAVRPGRWSDFLAACRLAAALELPPALAAFRSGRLVVAPADADLTSLGLPLVGPGHSALSVTPRSVGVQSRDATAPEPMLLKAIQALLRGLRAHTPETERFQRAEALEGILMGEEGRVTTLRLIGEYAVHVLRTSRSSATARNRLSGLLLIDAVTDHVPLPDLGADEWQETCVELVQACLRPSSMRVMRQRLQAFEKYLLRHGHIQTQSDWKDPELQVGREVTWQPVLLPGEIATLAEAARADGQDALAIVVLVGGLLGLRCSELTRLRLCDVLQGGLGELYIRRSKSDCSERTLPARLLLFPSIWQIVEPYHQCRASAATLPTDPWLVDPTGQSYSPDSLGQAFGRLTHRVLKRRLGLHALRRSFAAWLLLRWLAATGEIAPISDGSPLAAEMFSPTALAGVREAFELSATRAYGLGALWILAAFLGHASPEISVSYYLSSLEWLQFLMVDSGAPRQVGIQMAARVAGLSVRQLQGLMPQPQRPRGRVPLATLLELAVARIERGDKGGTDHQSRRRGE